MDLIVFIDAIVRINQNVDQLTDNVNAQLAGKDFTVASVSITQHSQE